MAQAQDSSAEARPGPAGTYRAGGTDAQRRWLALTDPSDQIDLGRLFPDIDVKVETTSAEFAERLDHDPGPGLIVLMAPPAGPADLERVSVWRANNPGSHAVVLSPRNAVSVRLHALELGFDDAIDLAADPMEVVGRLSILGRRTPGATSIPGTRVSLGEGVELDRRARAIRRTAAGSAM